MRQLTLEELKRTTPIKMQKFILDEIKMHVLLGGKEERIKTFVLRSYGEIFKYLFDTRSCRKVFVDERDRLELITICFVEANISFKRAIILIASEVKVDFSSYDFMIYCDGMLKNRYGIEDFRQHFISYMIDTVSSILAEELDMLAMQKMN